EAPIELPLRVVAKQLQPQHRGIGIRVGAGEVRHQDDALLIDCKGGPVYANEPTTGSLSQVGRNCLGGQDAVAGEARVESYTPERNHECVGALELSFEKIRDREHQYPTGTAERDGEATDARIGDGCVHPVADISTRVEAAEEHVCVPMRSIPPART